MTDIIIGVCLFAFGILFLFLGKKSFKNFENNRPAKEHYSGLLFQWNTYLIYSGFLLTISGIYFIISSLIQ